MSLVNREPAHFFAPMRDPFRGLFGRDVWNWPTTGDEESNVITSGWAPSVDIKESDEQFTIIADVPGVAPQEIEISMDNNILSIKGERVSESSSEEDGYRRVERMRGNFHRRFSLPDTADGDKITATGKDGVLEIVIPKREAAQTRRITVAT